MAGQTIIWRNKVDGRRVSATDAERKSWAQAEEFEPLADHDARQLGGGAAPAKKVKTVRARPRAKARRPGPIAPPAAPPVAPAPAE